MYSGANNDTIRDALFVLSHEALCVHRAIGELVKAGWYSPAAALARTPSPVVLTSEPPAA